MADVEVKKLPDPAWKAGIKNFIAGGAGGMSLVFVGHPLDTIKVKLQTAEAGKYSGIVDVARKTMKADGTFGLYKGMSAPLAGVTPIFALYFLGFDMGKRIAVNIGGPFVKKDGSINNLGVIFGGGFSAIPGTALMVPGDRIKVMLQAGTTHLKGPIEVGAHIIRTEGLVGLYKGTALTLARDGPGSMAYYGAYEVFKEMLSDGDQLSVPAVMTAGGLAGMFNWIVAVPPDTIKSKLQSAPEGRYPGGARQIMKELVAKEGMGALYKGIGPAMLRAVPGNAACFLGYELALKMLNKYW